MSSSPPAPQGEALRKALVRQVDYYFSAENLARDKYLLSQMDADKWVPIAVIEKFKMVRCAPWAEWASVHNTIVCNTGVRVDSRERGCNRQAASCAMQPNAVCAGGGFSLAGCARALARFDRARLSGRALSVSAPLHTDPFRGWTARCAIANPCR